MQDVEPPLLHSSLPPVFLFLPYPSLGFSLPGLTSTTVSPNRNARNQFIFRVESSTQRSKPSSGWAECKELMTRKDFRCVSYEICENRLAGNQRDPSRNMIFCRQLQHGTGSSGATQASENKNSHAADLMVLHPPPIIHDAILFVRLTPTCG